MVGNTTAAPVGGILTDVPIALKPITGVDMDSVDKIRKLVIVNVVFVMVVVLVVAVVVVVVIVT